MEKYKCPICDGTGKLELPRPTEREFRRQAILCLKKNGFGVRQIQRLLGFKSPRSVSFILENNNN